MLKNFKQIYNNELMNYDSGFIKRLLGDSEVRMFVYEICKRYTQEEVERVLKQANSTDAKNLGGCEICSRLDGSHHSDCPRYIKRR